MFQFLKNIGPILLIYVFFALIFNFPMVSFKQSEYDLLKEVLISQKEMDYEWLRDDLEPGVWNDDEVRAIADCVFDEQIDFLNMAKDEYSELVPEFRNVESRNIYYENLIQRKLYSSYSFADHMWSSTTSCMGEVSGFDF